MSQLFTAIQEEDLEALKAALAEGAPVNEPDEDDDFPLTLAARTQNGALIDALLAAGADPNVEDGLGFAPLNLALSYGNVDGALALLKAGADPNHTRENAWPPLHKAAGDGHVEVVEALLAKGVDPNQVALDHSPLSMTCWGYEDAPEECLAIGKALVRAGASLDELALRVAKKKKALKLIEALMPPKTDEPAAP